MTTIDAPQPDSRSVIRSTAATSAFVAGWYALPDYVRSKPTRALLKTVGLATFAALGIRDIRPEAGWRSAGDAPRHGAHAEQVPQAAALAGAVVVVLGSTALTAVVERRVFRRNEARAARGTRLPHTRSALLFGVLTALVAIPDVLHSRAVEAATSIPHERS